MSIHKFPQDFKWGVATASYQIEGAYNEDGRGMSIWDTFAHTPGKVKNGDNGNVACDSYHRVEEDVQLLKELGVKVYRFSVSWPRVLPSGRGEVNRAGLDYYHRLVDALLANGIEPFCTLYHWDLPQALQDEGGWGSRGSIDAFAHYAELMFNEFKGKIKHWITFNEPWCMAFLSNYLGVHAPGNKDLQLAIDVSHHLLVAHGKAVKRFRELGIPGRSALRRIRLGRCHTAIRRRISRPASGSTAGPAIGISTRSTSESIRSLCWNGMRSSDINLRSWRETWTLSVSRSILSALIITRPR